VGLRRVDVVVGEHGHGLQARRFAAAQPEAIVEQRGADTDGDHELAGREGRAEDPVVVRRGGWSEILRWAAADQQPGAGSDGPEQVGQVRLGLGHHVERGEHGTRRTRLEDARLMDALERPVGRRAGGRRSRRTALGDITDARADERSRAGGPELQEATPRDARRASVRHQLAPTAKIRSVPGTNESCSSSWLVAASSRSRCAGVSDWAGVHQPSGSW
jgi:hypothetical protein